MYFGHENVLDFKHVIETISDWTLPACAVGLCLIPAEIKRWLLEGFRVILPELKCQSWGCYLDNFPLTISWWCGIWAGVSRRDLHNAGVVMFSQDLLRALLWAHCFSMNKLGLSEQVLSNFPLFKGALAVLGVGSTPSSLSPPPLVHFAS